jgi:pimeloyl-ACP methyl ester carboxylesterase
VSVPVAAPTYEVAGPVAAPAIVLIHGTRLTRFMWRAQLDALDDEFRVYAIDLPGHGSRAAQSFSLNAASDVVIDLLEGVVGGAATLVGLSLGGYVAMDVAARRPELVRGLVISGATAEPIGLRATPYLALAWAMGRFDGPRLDALNAWFFRTRFPAALGQPIIAGGFWSAAGATALRSIVGQRFVPRLAAYPGPTLILNGEYDLLFRLAAPTFAVAARNARRVRLRGATHLANLDRPDAFTAAVRGFVRGLVDDDPAGA